MAPLHFESWPKLKEAKCQELYLDLLLAPAFTFGLGFGLGFGAAFAFPAAVNSGLARLALSGPEGSDNWRFLVFAKSANTDLTWGETSLLQVLTYQVRESDP